MAALTEHTILPLPAFDAPVKLLIVVSPYYRAIADDLICLLYTSPSPRDRG